MNKVLNNDSMKSVEKSMGASAESTGGDSVTTLLSRLVTIEERLSAQILSLAGREQVKISNTANYAVREPVLKGTNL